MSRIANRSPVRTRSPTRNRSPTRVRSPARIVQLQKHTFPIQQVKKLIGKKMIIIHPAISMTDHDKDAARVIKEKFREEKQKKKSFIIFAMYNDGIWQVYKNIEFFLAITSIPYREMENSNISVVINEHPKISRSELRKIL